MAQTKNTTQQNKQKQTAIPYQKQTQNIIKKKANNKP